MAGEQLTNKHFKHAVQLASLGVFMIIIALTCVAFDIGPNVAPDMKLIDVIASVFCLISLFAAAVSFIMGLYQSLIVGFKN